ncbi:BTB/POZ domain-containing protein [Aspergillus fischeri NRRL 181]|uniref:BTB domain-containing protein n=1 Tax=Neosartorya fischeri (strain ATCC 1020 / DSM 3700 / CBS 544.65 / FGSC A1164 / JCM 1740 / NRRL 181 / WB 181) TaxID=331117 RepID=A1CXF0_NEOFI|nr:conserved hypothetical protein [Aspergillus fischeri NRRL 181]EAW25302.1 conserved hypothetical protein [Aspergillus fischeri NRRL 181]
MSKEEGKTTRLEFLTSDTVALKSPGSTCTFKIHKDLLESKCKILHAAFTSGFAEGQDGVYTCSDTTDGTLARFIEWAYLGDYQASVISKDLVQTTLKASDDADEDNASSAAANVSESTDVELDNHPLLAHLRLYIFSDAYLIAELKQLAYEKLTACFVDINRPQTLDQQRAIIASLRVAFLKIPLNDSLLDWLAHYAAYSVNQLRLQPSFHDLLEAAPALCSRMMNTLCPASTAPWQCQTPKHRFPPYKPGSYEEQCEWS